MRETAGAWRRVAVRAGAVPWRGLAWRDRVTMGVCRGGLDCEEPAWDSAGAVRWSHGVELEPRASLAIARFLPLCLGRPTQRTAIWFQSSDTTLSPKAPKDMPDSVFAFYYPGKPTREGALSAALCLWLRPAVSARPPIRRLPGVICPG